MINHIIKKSYRVSKNFELKVWEIEERFEYEKGPDKVEYLGPFDTFREASVYLYKMGLVKEEK